MVPVELADDVLRVRERRDAAAVGAGGDVVAVTVSDDDGVDAGGRQARLRESIQQIAVPPVAGRPVAGVDNNAVVARVDDEDVHANHVGGVAGGGGVCLDFG